MSWADDAPRILRSFRRALDDIASGNYDLKKVARQEAGLFEEVKDALAKGQSSWHRDATRAENYLKELYRPLEREMREAIAPVVSERAAQEQALGRMVNSAFSEQAPDLVRTTLRNDAANMLNRATMAQRMQINDALSRARLTLDDLSEQELREIVRFLGGKA